jgi:hypothetical protein
MIGRIGLAMAVGASAVAGLLAWRAANTPEPIFPLPAAAPAHVEGQMSPAEIEADRQRNLAFERDQETAPFARWPAWRGGRATC